MKFDLKLEFEGIFQSSGEKVLEKAFLMLSHSHLVFGDNCTQKSKKDPVQKI